MTAIASNMLKNGFRQLASDSKYIYYISYKEELLKVSKENDTIQKVSDDEIETNEHNNRRFIKIKFSTYYLDEWARFYFPPKAAHNAGTRGSKGFNYKEPDNYYFVHDSYKERDVIEREHHKFNDDDEHHDHKDDDEKDND